MSKNRPAATARSTARPAPRRTRGRRGAIYVMAAFLTLPMLGTVALAVDVGAGQLAHARLQHAALAAQRAAEVVIENTGDDCATLQPRLEALALDVQRMHAGDTLFGATPHAPTVTCQDGRPVVTSSSDLRRTFIQFVQD